MGIITNFHLAIPGIGIVSTIGSPVESEYTNPGTVSTVTGNGTGYIRTIESDFIRFVGSEGGGIGHYQGGCPYTCFAGSICRKKGDRVRTNRGWGTTYITSSCIDTQPVGGTSQPKPSGGSRGRQAVESRFTHGTTDPVFGNLRSTRIEIRILVGVGMTRIHENSPFFTQIAFDLLTIGI